MFKFQCNKLDRLILRFISPAFMLMIAACSPSKFSTDSSPAAVNPGSGSGTGNPTPAVSLKEVNYTTTVNPTDNKVDIILVLDNSNSMLPDNQRLASKLETFVNNLQNSNLDWQACVTVTSAVPTNNGSTAWGASFYWQNSSTFSNTLGLVLKKGQTDLPAIFSSTINYIGAGWANTDDERAIKAAYQHVYNGDYNYSGVSGCYRPDASIAYIIISDEDERSVGGNQSQRYYANEYRALEPEDLPENFVAYVKSTFGSAKRFTVNSIIVKPSDTTCMTAQDTGAKSHFGTKYAELSALTGGGVGSICDTDFAGSLNLFADRIKSSLSSVPLECLPVGEVTITTNPTVADLNTRIQGMNLIFNKELPLGTSVNLAYRCSSSESRAPSSVKEPAAKIESIGFFAKITAFIKSIFGF